MTLKLDGSTLKRTEKDQSSYVAASLATNLWWFLPSIWRGPMGTLTTEIIVPMNSPSFCPTPVQFSHKDVIAGHIPKDSKSPALRRHTQSYQSDKPTKKNSYVSLKFQWTNQHLQMPVLRNVLFPQDTSSPQWSVCGFKPKIGWRNNLQGLWVDPHNCRWKPWFPG